MVFKSYSYGTKVVILWFSEENKVHKSVCKESRLYHTDTVGKKDILALWRVLGGKSSECVKK